MCRVSTAKSWGLGFHEHQTPSDETLRRQSYTLTKRCQLGRVCDYRLGYQHARRTHTIAAFNFLHRILAYAFQRTLLVFVLCVNCLFTDDFKQMLFALGHWAWLDVDDAERANRKVVTAERYAGVKA